MQGEVLTIEDFLAKSLFISNMGIWETMTSSTPIYYLSRIRKPIPTTHANFVVSQYNMHLKNLHKYGARKILMTGLAPLGCIPIVIGLYSKDINQCYEPHNQVTTQFNTKMKLMVEQLNEKFPSAYFHFWDVYPLFMQIIVDPSQYGFKYSHSACCGGGWANGLNLCTRLSPLCRNRSEYAFWDLFHPSDSLNKIAAAQAYEGTLQSTYPMNVKQLLQL